MRILASLLIFFCSASFANELLGTWQSDKEKTLAWNKENLKLTSEFEEFLEHNLGYLYFTFTEDKVCTAMDEYETVRKGKKETNESWETVTTYKITAESEYGFIIEQVPLPDYEELLGHAPPTFTLAIFESKDSMYFEPLTPNKFGHDAFREYLKPATPNKSINACAPMAPDAASRRPL